MSDLLSKGFIQRLIMCIRLELQMVSILLTVSAMNFNECRTWRKQLKIKDVLSWQNGSCIALHNISQVINDSFNTFLPLVKASRES